MNGRLVERAALAQPERARMLELLTAHFEGVTPRQFAHDLEEKQWVILLEDDAGFLR